VLRDRDQKQVDFEQLSAYLQQTMQDKERIKYPGRNNNNPTWHLSELVVDTIKQVRGMDMERARREKLVQLEVKIKELQEEVARTNDISHSFSDQVVHEFDLFQQCKTNELKQGLAAYADCHVDFYQKVYQEKARGMKDADGYFF
jgi:sorting nexin-4